MRHRTDSIEKLARALELHERGVGTAAIAERLGIPSNRAARTITQAKERRARLAKQREKDGVVVT